MNYRAWQLKKEDDAAEQALRDAGYGTLLARVLAARGFDTADKADALLHGHTPLSDPYLLKDMDKAVARIRRAIESEEPIVIFGDYDVDGVSATALLYEYLTNLGAHVRCKLPSRDGGGYGINRDTLKSLSEKGYTLVVTVDNGISAVEEAAYARQLGIDLVITDHHLPPDPLPDAVAVVDPSRTDDQSPCKTLCGAGVAFKLCAALEECDPNDLLEECGDLAAIGTVADVVALDGENRTIVRKGLELLQDTMRPGLAVLLENAGLSGKPVTAENISYTIAPRLNAAGRMDSASIALKLLLCSDEEQAEGIAARLGESNTLRQATEQQILTAALAQLEQDPARASDRVIVVWGENWHSGVIGIVASRLMERFGRPVVVVSLQNGEGRGSGRAPAGFNLHCALQNCAGHLIRYGGHAAAAGLMIEEEKLAAFRQAINAWAAKEYPMPQPQQICPDAAVHISDLTLDAVAELSQLAPFGGGNPVPLFLIRNAQIDGLWPLGTEGRHTRIRLRQGKASCFVSLFGTAPDMLAYRQGTMVDAVVEVSIFEGRNGPMVSAHLKTIRPAGLGNEPSRQVALFDALCSDSGLPAGMAAEFLPTRADTVTLYRRLQTGSVSAEDLQPLFADMGVDNTGKTLASLRALTELGLIETRNGKFQPVAVSGKKDLASAPILKKIANRG